VIPLFYKTRKSYLQVLKRAGKILDVVNDVSYISVQNHNPKFFEFRAAQKLQNMIHFGVLKICTVHYTHIHNFVFIFYVDRIPSILNSDFACL
jgi:hypothetical protein